MTKIGRGYPAIGGGVLWQEYIDKPKEALSRFKEALSRFKETKRYT